MKKALTLAALVGTFAFSAMAEDVTGYVIDQMCSSKAEMRGNVQCATKCIKGGSPAVLVTEDGKIYQITDQKKVTAEAGKKVTISGTLNGDTIAKVSKIKAAS